ncbi:protein aspartic protease in guard cell 1 [Phtheirospermum japonicum]|uniref:Protein aspartic protease in guard cell 1 n=1 Tax=Phtheirospermum japonicum TaxID=374723 RepID=A0A830CAH7_9LAMI|nr:protein aspartic protease in guard cell 1 [Phtheirospermum japonicum]
MTTTAPLFSLAAILFFSLAHGLNTTTPCGVPDPQGSTLRLIHVNSPCSPFRPKTRLSWQDTVLQMQSNDKARLQYLSSLVTSRSIVPIAPYRSKTQSPTYIVRAKIGTPAQTLFVAVDTSNDAAWFSCAGCAGCPDVNFNFAKSSTFKHLSCGASQCKQVPKPSCRDQTCGFNWTYGSSTLSADLAQDYITLATDTIPKYTFGCVRQTTGNSFPAQGLLGLGRGPLSLFSQTGSLYQSTFSYCLPSYNSSKSAGSLRLGPNSQPKNIKTTTTLLKNPRRSSLYYVNLMAIRVGRRVVNIPPAAFAFDPNTGAGTVFDSGTVFTSLVKSAYMAVRDEVRLQMPKATVSSLGAFDTCYKKVNINVRFITFMFKDMNLTLPQDNFIIHSSDGTTACLAMVAAPDRNINSVLNVIASFQQQNHRVLIDVPNSKLGVRHEQCS